MSSITPVSSSTTTTSTEDSDSGSSRVTQKTLGQDDFLKLLVTQFQMQDPTKPMEDTEFIAQMAQFSALENSKLLASDLSALRGEQHYVIANSYLGQSVTVENEDGEEVTGIVSAVDSTGSEPELVIDGTNYSLSSVLRVEPAATGSTTSATADQTKS